MLNRMILCALLAVAALTPWSAVAGSPEPITVLVTNDDGVDAPGLDALVEAIRNNPDYNVIVSAPATQQSGTSDNFTHAPLTATATTTLSGYPAWAVDGFPADAVVYALDVQGVKPDVVLSGINSGQNMGILTELSGTVGAARTAARRGIPAFATSQGINTEPGTPSFDFQSGAFISAIWLWFSEHRLSTRDALDVPSAITNLNTPSCNTGTSFRGVVSVPVAPDAMNYTLYDCASTQTNPIHDIEAYNFGFAPISQIDLGDHDVTIGFTAAEDAQLETIRSCFNIESKEALLKWSINFTAALFPIDLIGAASKPRVPPTNIFEPIEYTVTWSAEEQETLTKVGLFLGVNPSHAHKSITLIFGGALAHIFGC